MEVARTLVIGRCVVWLTGLGACGSWSSLQAVLRHARGDRGGYRRVCWDRERLVAKSAAVGLGLVESGHLDGQQEGPVNGGLLR